MFDSVALSGLLVGFTPFDPSADTETLSSHGRTVMRDPASHPSIHLRILKRERGG